MALTAPENPLAEADREWFAAACSRAGVKPSGPAGYEFVIRMARLLPQVYRTDEHTVQSMRNRIFKEVSWAL